MTIMKVVLASIFVASVAALSQQESASTRREALKGFASAAGAVAFLPNAANAAAGESPRFSIFGLFGDPSAYSESTAYGLDQEDELYSPYSVYPEAGPDSLYDEDAAVYVNRKKAVLKETRVRINKLPAYIEKKKWFEVTNELNRYMYETRGAVQFLTDNVYQQEAADEFFVALEKIANAARLKQQAPCASAVTESLAKLDKFESKL